MTNDTDGGGLLELLHRYGVVYLNDEYQDRYDLVTDLMMMLVPLFVGSVCLYAFYAGEYGWGAVLALLTFVALPMLFGPISERWNDGI